MATNDGENRRSRAADRCPRRQPVTADEMFDKVTEQRRALAWRGPPSSTLAATKRDGEHGPWTAATGGSLVDIRRLGRAPIDVD